MRVRTPGPVRRQPDTETTRACRSGYSLLSPRRCCSAGGPRCNKKLRNLLSVNGAGFVRYFHGMPTALVLLAIADPDHRRARAGDQCAGSFCRLHIGRAVPDRGDQSADHVVWLSQFRGWHGLKSSKTKETVQSAILAFFVLNEHPRTLAWIRHVHRSYRRDDTYRSPGAG